jgi:hypothetical protein
MHGERVCHLLQVFRVVDGNGANNLNNMILTALMHHGDLFANQVSKKIICFDADGASVVVQLTSKFFLYIMNLHDVVHCTNLIVWH